MNALGTLSNRSEVIDPSYVNISTILGENTDNDPNHYISGMTATESSTISDSVETKTDSINESNGSNISSLQYAWSDYNSKIFYTNADSLLNKTDELLALITNNQFDNIVITEVLPKNRDNLQINIVEFSINGYNIFSTDLGISNGIALNVLEYQHIEAIGIKIKLRNNNWLF